MPIVTSNCGYRSLISYAYSTIIRIETIFFCQRVFTRDNDPLGRLAEQMFMSARSANANIAEGSARGGTSLETEIRLTDVAKGSLIELQCDLEAWLMQTGSLPWQFASPEMSAVKAIEIDKPPAKFDDVFYEYAVYILNQRKLFQPWFQDGTPIDSANALLYLCHRTLSLLSHQIDEKAKAFLANGDMRERMNNAKYEGAEQGQVTAPSCPDCGSTMVLKNGRKGKFWGCSMYPNCQRTLSYIQ